MYTLNLLDGVMLVGLAKIQKNSPEAANTVCINLQKERFLKYVSHTLRASHNKN